MSDDWNRFVRVIRADGSERTLPLAAWTEDLEKRVVEAGGRVVMVDENPEKAEVAEQAQSGFAESSFQKNQGAPAARSRKMAAPVKATPVAARQGTTGQTTAGQTAAGQTAAGQTAAGQTATAQTATMPRRGAGQRDEDLAIIQQLMTNVDALTPWESEFSTSIASWLEGHDTLTDKQRSKASQILSELD